MPTNTMTTAQSSLDEARRMKYLRQYGVLDTPPEQALDELTALAAQICETPIAWISLIDENSQWFKATFGLEMVESPRSASFCSHALDQRELFIVPDAAQDERFAQNPLVTGEPRIRFYAGAPLVGLEDTALGTLCVIDRVPRTLTELQKQALQVLARQVMAHLELRRQTRELVASEERLRVVTDNARVGLVLVNQDRRYTYANNAYAEILGLPSSAIVGERVQDVLPEIYEEQIAPKLARAFSGQLVMYELHKPAPAGDSYYEVRYEPRTVDGAVALVLVVITDITERKKSELVSLRLAAIVEFSDDAIIGKDLNGIIGSWNRGAEKIFGHTASEMVGSSIMRLIPNDRRDEENQILGKIKRGESVEHFETLRWTKDGRLIDVSVTASPIKDADGKPIGVSKVARDITERKSAEEALRQSEERFRDMLNGIPQLAWMAQADGSLFWYNQRWYEYTGTTSEEMEGWGWQIVQDPEFLPKVLERWKASIADGAAFEMEFPLRAADGHFGMFLTRVMPLKDAHGRVLRWFGTNTDISERRRAEQRLAELAGELSRRAEELASSREVLEAQTVMFKLVLASMGEGLIAADLEGRFLIFNDAALDMMGRGPEDLPTEQWTSHYKVFLPDGITPYPPDSLPLVRAIRGESVQVELIVQSSEARSMDVTARPLRDARGNLCGGVAVLRDVTERKRVEGALQEREEQLRLYAAHSPAAIAMLDRDMKYVVVSRRWMEVYRLEEESIIGRSHYEMFPEISKQWKEIHQRCMAGAVEKCDEEAFLRADGNINWIRWEVRPWRGADGSIGGIIIFSEDISERKAASEQIHQLNVELEQRVIERTQQLETANKELEAFSYSVSHDLRAPLRAVNGFSKIVLDKFGSQVPVDAREYLELICKGGEQMEELIDDLLAFSKFSRQSMSRQAVDSVKLVQTVLDDSVSQRQGRPIELHVGNLPPCQGDEALLKQVWANLISNAIKYTRGREPAVIEIGCQRTNNENVYFVRDNGAGFDMQYASKLFGVFQRLHDADEFEGTGVGLAIVQRIVNRHGGSIWAAAEVGRGATFSFTLEPTDQI
jgi:PAS domain S-box-containing protein